MRPGHDKKGRTNLLLSPSLHRYALNAVNSGSTSVGIRWVWLPACLARRLTVQVGRRTAWSLPQRRSCLSSWTTLPSRRCRTSRPISAWSIRVGRPCVDVSCSHQGRDGSRRACVVDKGSQGCREVQVDVRRCEELLPCVVVLSVWLQNGSQSRSWCASWRL
jgi:hypothetical protein